MRDQTLRVILVVAILLTIAAMYYIGGKPAKDGYLIAPYLDLDEPGERGSYYGLVDCPPA